MRINKISDFIDLAIQEGLYSNKNRLMFYLNSVFDGIDFYGKNVLDIGGGAGLCSFYSAVKGAQKILCLEPEVAGSNSNSTSKFSQIKEKLKFENVHLSNSIFQEYEFLEQYDIIILHDSINHLDEQACINLLMEPKAEEAYIAIFRKINMIAKANCTIIISDCARSNFFSFCHLVNPFVPTIAWNKHQNPEKWISLFEEFGIQKNKLFWMAFNRLGTIGRLLFGNRILAYFHTSYFVLHLKKLDEV